MKVIQSIAEFFGLKFDKAEMRAVSESAVTRLACKNLAFYIASSYISNALSKCEFKTYEKGRSVKGELYYALNVSPNPNQNGSQFVNELVERCLYKGEALMVQPRRSKNHFYIAETFSEKVNPMRRNSFESVVVEGETVRRRLLAGDVCHFKLENKKIYALVSDMYADLGKVLAQAVIAYGKAAGEKYTFERPSNPGGKPEEVKEAYETINEQLRSFVGAASGVMPIYRDQKLTRIDASRTGSVEDVSAMRKDIFEMTAAAFKIPNSMMYGNMTNATEVTNQFITFGVDPWAKMIGDEMTRGFYDFDSWDGGRSYVRVDTSHIAHVDVFQMADKIEKLISSGYDSIDEVRLAVGDDPIDEDFSKAHWMTKNYSLIQEALMQISTGMTGGGETNEG